MRTVKIFKEIVAYIVLIGCHLYLHVGRGVEFTQ